MLKRAVNELEFTVEIAGESRLLVKDGRYDAEKKKEWAAGKKEIDWPSMIFMCSDDLSAVKAALETNAYGGLHYYVAGSSMRGAWRSHLEKVLRSLDEESKVCDPFSDSGPEIACSRRLAEQGKPAEEHPYRESCPVCKLFGDSVQGGRIAISDAGLERGKPVVVTNVSIRRQTGTVEDPFKSLVLENATFQATVRLRNFELWQVGLVGHLFADLKNKRIPLGSGKNKGFGSVSAKARKMSVTYFGRADGLKDGRLRGVEELMPNAAGHYGFVRSSAQPEVGTDRDEDASSLWRHVSKVRDPEAFWSAVRPCFDVQVWDRMQRQPAAGEVPDA